MTKIYYHTCVDYITIALSFVFRYGILISPMSVIHTLSGQNGWPSLLLIAGEVVNLRRLHGQCFSVIVSFLHYPESNECRKHKIILQKSTMISIVVSEMLFKMSWTL